MAQEETFAIAFQHDATPASDLFNNQFLIIASDYVFM